jgi:hypothetical protein
VIAYKLTSGITESKVGEVKRLWFHDMHADARMLAWLHPSNQIGLQRGAASSRAPSSWPMTNMATIGQFRWL